MTELHAAPRQAPIAVVGIGSMYPGSSTAAGFWQDIVRARDLMTEVPDTHWLIEDYYDPDPARPDKTYCRRGAFLSPVEFDPMEFAVPPAMLRSTDTSQLLSLIVARDVLDDVFGGRPAKLVRDRTSVVLGFAAAQELVSPLVSRLQRPIWAKAMRDAGVGEAMVEAVCDRIAEQFVPWDEASFPGLLGNVVAGRIANRLDLHGANLTTDAACASSLAAVHTAVNQLLLGEADLAIAGGADANNDIFVYLCFSKTPALSRTEDCRPFSDRADGTMMGEGIGMVALKRLDDAERDGNRIYAVIRGIGSSSDGRSKSIYAPRSDGQALALQRCYLRAGYGPESVELVEAHGTGTHAGDLAEMEGLRAVFGGARDDGRHTTALGSVKSQIGHTKAAAGAAGLLKVVMALHQKVLPPTIKVDRPDPGLNLADSPFYVNTVARPWVGDGSQPRRASVSAFGFGGTNYHVTLEEYIPPGTSGAKSSLRTARDELFLLSGETSAALAARCTAMALEHGDFAARAFASQGDFNAAAPIRLAIVAGSGGDLAAKLAMASACLRESDAPSLATPDGVYISSAPPVAGDIALLFPGQGSQYVGMGAELAMSYPRARRIWDAAASTRFDGLALHEVVYPSPAFSDDERAALEARLRATEWAQPALGLASGAGSALLHAVGLRPRWLLGHSFGELAALCAAGSISARDLLKLARVRGELMRDAASESPGAMSAVFASPATVRSLIDRAGASAVIANYNSDEETVVSGSHEALERIEKLCASEQIVARRLPVAAAFHSPAVAGAVSRFAEALADVDVRPPTVEILANADAQPYPGDPDGIRKRLAEQLAQPVRFADMVREAHARGARVFVEVGPGAVLSGLASRILKDEPHLAVSIDRKHRDGVTSLHHALAQLAAAGQPLDLSALWETYQPPPARPPKRPGATVMLTGTNYGKPYPPKEARSASAGTQRPANGAGHLPGGRQRPAGETQPPAVGSRRLTAAADQGALQIGAKAAAPAARHMVGTPQPAEPPTAAASQPGPSLHSGPVFAPPPSPAGGLEVARAAVPPVLTLGHEPGAGTEASWAQAYDNIQRRVADTHVAVTRAMADMHAAFLASMASAFSDPVAMVSGQPLPAAVPPSAGAGPSLGAAALALPPRSPADAESRSRPLAEPAFGYGTAAAVPSAPADLADAAADMPDNPGPGAVAPALDLAALLLSVIAEKTGYQQDMLALGMELEADLGIDSIKRVEILAAMRDAVPALPDVDPAAMAGIRTLGDVVEYLQSTMGEAVSPAADRGDAAAPPFDLAALLLSVIAEKTGYQQDMLALGMELEADLGIDSIKRVEILAAMRDAVPALPDVDPAAMAGIRTLGDVVEYLQGAADGGVAAPSQEWATLAMSSVSDATPAVERLVLRMVPRPALGLSLAGLREARRVVVTGDSADTAAGVVRALIVAGVAAETVAEVPDDADAVIYLGGLGAVRTADDAVAVNREAFRLARAIAPRFARAGGVFVTVQDTGGDFGLSGRDGIRAWLGGVAALARTARQEWPAATVKVIDCERGNRSAGEVAEAIVAELLAGAESPDIGLAADGSRRRPELAAQPGPEGEFPLEDGAVIVASGGARGVTAACLEELARACRPRLVLLGRTALAEEPACCEGASDEAEITRALIADARGAGRTPGMTEVRDLARSVLAVREVRQALQVLERAGAQVRYLTVDVRDDAAVARALEDVRAQFGPVKGLVHGAGVLADKLIADKTDDQFGAAFDTKVLGLRALLAATEHDPLAYLCLFSSVVAQKGNPGQSDYAMANEILNHVASAEQARRGTTCSVRSIGWGSWDAGMVTPSLQRHFTSLGIPLLATEAGRRAFGTEIRSAGDVVVVVGSGGMAEAAVSARVPDAAFDLWICRENHPYLTEHAIGGVPVVPVALVAEWFHRALDEVGHGRLPVLRSLKVLTGVRLDQHLTGEALRLTRHFEDGCWHLVLRSPDGQPAYSASADFGSWLPDFPATVEPPGRPVECERLYDGRTLFHGPAFHALRSLEHVASGGMSADVIGLTELGWPDEAWRTDPAALDAMLQLGLKWSEHLLGGATLPMGFQSLHIASHGPMREQMRATVRTRQLHHSRAVCDITLASVDGTLLAALGGVDYLVRPDLPATARRAGGLA